MKKFYGFCETSFFLGNKRQHMAVCDKIISSWVRKVLSMAKTHMSLGTVCGAATFVAGVSLLSILLAGDWARVSTQLDTISQHISLLQIGTRILCRLLSWALVSSELVGKCQTLTYTKFCRYFGLLGCSFLQYWVNSFHIVCMVLALDTWNYCSREQDPTAWSPILSVCPNGFIA